MKILLAYEWCQIGGVEAFMAALAKTLRARGHTCEFFFFEHGPMEKYLPPDCAALFGDMADCLTLVRARRYDIVHANSSDWNFGISTARLAGARLVITAHGMVVPGWNSTNCDGFACVSRWQADEQHAFTDLPIHVVYNGIDIDKFRPAAERAAADASPIVVWVGRGTDMVHKRIDKLAAIAPMLRAAGVRLWIADPYGPEAVARVVPEAARVLRACAEFWGEVAKDKLPDFYRQVAASGGCILSTSVREGFGLVMAEAQACGCPAIGPDVVGINEVVRPEHGGVLYPFELAPERLAELVLATLHDTERMRERSEAAARFAHAEFDLARMADDYVRVYAEALERPMTPFSFRARQWLAPVLDWRAYVAHRWTAGRAQYETSRKLAARGEWALAAAVARTSLAMCPTQFAKPERLAHLCKALLTRPAANLSGTQALK